MMRVLGQYRTAERGWLSYWGDDGRGEPDESGAEMVANKRQPSARIAYPTLMQISMHLRRGTEVTHEQLVELLAAPWFREQLAYRMRPQSLRAEVAEIARDPYHVGLDWASSALIPGHS